MEIRKKTFVGCKFLAVFQKLFDKPITDTLAAMVCFNLGGVLILDTGLLMKLLDLW